MDIQHHVAHFAAVLGEHALLRSNRPILGVIWDGTGWGEKEHGRKPAIWGGEFFRFADRQFQRVDHLDYFPHLLGDKLAKEPRLSALALCHDLPAARPFLRPLFTETEWTLYRKMIARGGDFITSSVGRLFDGVAALLGLAPVSSFEGEAAMQLETLAMHCRKTARDFSTPDAINRSVILHELLADLIAGREKADIAFRFHLLLVRWIEQVARRQGVAELAFSGGVFQNALLHDLIRQELGDAFTLYFHQALSPNDECIAFGQLCYAYLMREGSLGEEGMDISEIDSGFVGRLTV